MGRFLKHEPCNRCHSRDNLGRYTDGSAYCFGCGYREAASGRAIFEGIRKDYGKNDNLNGLANCAPLPDDFGTEYSTSSLDWVYQYEITVAELIANNVGYSKRWNQLINPFYEDGQLVMWSGRNFNKNAKSKYFISGDKNDVYRVFLHSNSTNSRDNINNSDCSGGNICINENSNRVLVIVEDCMSAIKVARYKDSFPLLGSTLNNKMISRLKRSYDVLGASYDRMIVWLDPDKTDNAIDLAKRASLIGFKTRVISTTVDPKEVSSKEIQELLDN